jgi:cysteine desulfurase
LLAVDSTGRLDPQVVAARCDGRTGLVCGMLVNNETGTIHDVPALASIAHRAGALLFTDLAQAPLRLAVDLPALGADLAAISGSKIHGPPGTGALWLRRGLGLDPRMFGGGQERGLRPGTENAPGLAGLEAAITAACTAATRHVLVHLDGLLARGLAELPSLRLHRAEHRAPGILMLTVPGSRHSLLRRLPKIAASAGASCAAGRPSHVLVAQGLSLEEAKTAVRFSLGANSTEADVTGILAAVRRAL